MTDKEIITEILNLEKEIKRRRDCDKLSGYNRGKKVHKKQMEFHKCKSRNRWAFGGNRSGKTECGAVETVWRARGIHPFRENKPSTTGWVVSLSYEVQRDVAQAKVLYYINPDWIHDIAMQSGKRGSPEYGVIDYILIKNVFGGLSKIAFKSVDQGREKFQGVSLDWVWFDEEPPKDIYDECRMRVLDRCGETWGTMTPLKGLTWVYNEIYLNARNNSEIWHIHMEWADNPFLDKSETELLTDSMTDDEIQSRRYGLFTSGTGLVYPEFSARHVIEPFQVPVEWYDNITVDPGLNNPLACLFCAVDYDGNVYVIGEHYKAGENIDYHSEKIFALANKLNWHRDSKGRLNALIDSAAKQRTLASLKSVADLFYERDILVNANVDKNLFSGISRLKHYFKADKIKIFKTCPELIRELKSYWWGEGDRPKKADDHALDALRYYIMTKPAPHEQLKPTPTVIQNDKAKLIRNLKRS